MLVGRADVLPKLDSSKDVLLCDPVSELNEDEELDTCGQILYTASFKELASKYVQYETIIWVLISLLLISAWGVGILMLLYLPVRRYVLQKEISSRKLYVTAHEIVYKVSRPSFVPFWGVIMIKKRIPLSRVIDIIIEQGCLQSVYGMHTFRVESIARGKVAAVDELQVQGINNPELLRKIILTEASKIRQVGRSQKSIAQISEGESMVSVSSTEDSAVSRSPSKSWKITASQHPASFERRGTLFVDLLLQKLEEVNKSVKKIELLMEKCQTSPGRS